MLKKLVVVAALCSACSGKGSPAGPTPPPVVQPPPPPPVISNITVTPCPETLLGVSFDVGFYREIGCNTFDGPSQSLRRWAVAPKLYLRTIDEAGAPIDAVTLDTVQNAMAGIAPQMTGGKFGLASIERGAESREGVSGYITVKWPATGNICGTSDVARDGGTITLFRNVAGCGCDNTGGVRPRTAQHELGHALGYWHTDNASELMSNIGTKPCTQAISARESAAMAYHYR